MDTKVTFRTLTRLIAGSSCLFQLAFSQQLTQTASDMARAESAWRKLGNDSVGLSLAGPAGGPVDAVWFSATGTLFARTHSGQVLETSDFSTWTVSKTPASPVGEVDAINILRTPEPGAKVLSLRGRGRYYALGVNLAVSEDFGSTWTNLTAYNRDPVIGSRQHSVAVSPDARQLVVANDFGVWLSADGGSSWVSLNAEMPNLQMRRLLPSSTPGTIRAEIEGIGVVELPPAAAAAHTNWIPARDPLDPMAPVRQKASQALGTKITAVAVSATIWFAGSDDGRLWSSSDGAQWTESGRASGPVEAIQAGDSSSALAIAAGATGARILRTTNNGQDWEDLSAGLPEGALHGVAVDAAAGVAYVAGDRGVFMAHVDINNPAPISAWQSVSGLPDARAMDVRLDPVRNLLYVAMDGYGLYAAPAPHTAATVRVLTAADQTAEAAAPGVLLRVQGGGFSSVRAEGGELAVVASSPSSAQVQVPFEASGTTLGLTVESSIGQSRFAIPMKAVAPSILVDGDGFPILVDAASGLTLDARNMAHPGGRIQVFAAGLGKVNPNWRAGIPAPDDPPVVVAPVEARLNGNAVEVTRATLAPGYVGLYLVEVQLPGLLNAGAADFSLVVNGEASNHVKILLSME